MLGLDAAGKTTILYQFKLKQTIPSVPTIGFNIQEVNYKNLNFTIWDVAGQSRFLGMWRHYFFGTDVLIYVLDSSDIERLDAAKELLEQITSHEEIKKIPILVLANKMDIGTLKIQQIEKRIGLHQLKRNWHLQPCCAINGQGIIQGFEWIRKQLK